MLISIQSLRSDRGNVLAQRGILDGPWEGHLSGWGGVPRRRGVWATGRRVFRITGVKEIDNVLRSAAN